MGPPWIVPWRTISCCISVTSLSVEPLPSFLRIKWRAFALHCLDPHHCLMSYPLGCNYERRSLVGNEKIFYTMLQHPILCLGLCNLPLVLVGQLSGELPLDHIQPAPLLLTSAALSDHQRAQLRAPFLTWSRREKTEIVTIHVRISHKAPQRSPFCPLGILQRYLNSQLCSTHCSQRRLELAYPCFAIPGDKRDATIGCATLWSSAFVCVSEKDHS